MILDVQGWMNTYQVQDLKFPGARSTLVKQGHFNRKYPVLAENHGQF
jgi:hypothetical protein